MSSYFLCCSNIPSNEPIVWSTIFTIHWIMKNPWSKSSCIGLDDPTSHSSKCIFFSFWTGKYIWEAGPIKCILEKTFICYFYYFTLEKECHLSHLNSHLTKYPLNSASNIQYLISLWWSICQIRTYIFWNKILKFGILWVWLWG